MSSDNYIDYPSMTRQREAKIQQGLVAKADDVNAELNNVVSTFNNLVSLLQGEFGGNGRIYELVDEAVAAAEQAKTDAANAVKKTGDTMTGQLTTQLEPNSPYSMVNKQYVDNTISTSVGPTSTLANSNKERLDNLDATNIKLSNGNFSSNTVDGGMTELFQSVSSGKASIASAITDKGVTTDANATFTQMTNNIYSIVTFVEGTALGTITPEKVLKGYLGYSKGQAIYGTHECDASSILEQADPLIPDNIAYGKKAFGSNGLITGTHKDSGGGTEYPTYGTDTSDGTATASDILEGKVAYSQGVRLTGTLKQVEELYKYNFNTITDISINGGIGGDITDIDGSMYFITASKISKDGKSIVRVGYDKSDNTKEVIFSNPIIDGQITIEQSIGADGTLVTKKYKYTTEELGITGTIQAFDITCGGVLGNNNLAYLVLFSNSAENPSGDGVDDVLHIYPYHLTGNRQIGPLTGETAKNYTFDLANYKNNISSTNYFKNNNVKTTYDKALYYSIIPNKSPYYVIAYSCNSFGYYGVPYKFRINPYAEGDNAVLTRISYLNSSYSSANNYSRYLKFSEDDSYYYTVSQDLYILAAPEREQILYLLDNTYNVIDEIPNSVVNVSATEAYNYRYSADVGYRKDNGWFIASGKEKGMEESDYTKGLLKLYKVVKDSETGNYSRIEMPSLNAQMNNYLYTVGTGVNTGNYLRYVTWVGNMAVILMQTQNNGGYSNDNIILLLIQLNGDGKVLNYNSRILNSKSAYEIMENIITLGSDSNLIIRYKDLYSANYPDNYILKDLNLEETEEVIGIIYQNKIYYNSQVESLTAGQPDVRAGKTFIGYMGYVEEGTMEVE